MDMLCIFHPYLGHSGRDLRGDFGRSSLHVCIVGGDVMRFDEPPVGAVSRTGHREYGAKDAEQAFAFRTRPGLLSGLCWGSLLRLGAVDFPGCLIHDNASNSIKVEGIANGGSTRLEAAAERAHEGHIEGESPRAKVHERTLVVDQTIF